MERTTEYMTDGEIVRSYKLSRDKGEQITILAELNACDTETIMAILLRYGAIDKSDMYTVKCMYCGAEVMLPSRRWKHICPECRRRNEAIKEIRYKLRLNAINLQNTMRRVAEINNDTKKLQKELEELEKERGTINGKKKKK